MDGYTGNMYGTAPLCYGFMQASPCHGSPWSITSLCTIRVQEMHVLKVSAICLGMGSLTCGDFMSLFVSIPIRTCHNRPSPQKSPRRWTCGDVPVIKVSGSHSSEAASACHCFVGPGTGSLFDTPLPGTVTAVPETAPGSRAHSSTSPAVCSACRTVPSPKRRHTRGSPARRHSPRAAH